MEKFNRTETSAEVLPLLRACVERLGRKREEGQVDGDAVGVSRRVS
jgi:hypothetical protein